MSLAVNMDITRCGSSSATYGIHMGGVTDGCVDVCRSFSERQQLPEAAMMMARFVRKRPPLQTKNTHRMQLTFRSVLELLCLMREWIW